MAEIRLVVYRGDSMAGTFRAGDLLRVAPLDGAARVGEVIVYRDDAGARVVHRVLAVDADGSVRTRGDAHARLDDLPVMPARIEGRVVSVVRAPAPAPLRMLRRLFGAGYRALGRRAWLRAALRALFFVELRAVRFARDDREIIKVLHRGRTVAEIYPETGRMRTRAPWALFVDPPDHPADAARDRRSEARADRD